jgi:hypothetical protein
MIRRETFVGNNLFYDGRYLAEDYELWARVVAFTGFTNIPEILGEYRIGKNNITSVFDANEQVRYYERQALMNAIAAKWSWAKHRESLYKRREIKAFEEIFDDCRKPTMSSRINDVLTQNRTTRARLQKTASGVLRLFVKPMIARVAGKMRDLRDG